MDAPVQAAQALTMLFSSLVVYYLKKWRPKMMKDVGGTWNTIITTFIYALVAGYFGDGYGSDAMSIYLIQGLALGGLGTGLHGVFKRQQRNGNGSSG